MNLHDGPRFLMIGGFLGAGKTTTIAQLARCYRDQGLTVGIVTNDQADNLVDTQWLRGQGFDVGEVAGACFCCSFDELTETIGTLSPEQPPDVILAEPVGSCTDLVATVAQPLIQLYAQQFRVGPYSVILKPSHGRRILADPGQGGFSPDAEYIFRKQLEEADVILINRIDVLTVDEVDELEELIDRDYPGRRIVRMSARTGEGIDTLLSELNTERASCRRVLDLNYDRYAAGEAELGWLNADVKFHSPINQRLDELLMELMQRLCTALRSANAEPAHLKVFAQTSSGAQAMANLVSRDTPVTLSLASNTACREAHIVVNARVVIAPDRLLDILRAVTAAIAEQRGCELAIVSERCLRPGRPVPTHRLTAADS